MEVSMDANKFAYTLSTILAILMVGAFFKGCAAGSGAPPEWLVGWTDWVLSALGVVLAPLALVTTAQVLRRLK
jgi:hypothetical protein